MKRVKFLIIPITLLFLCSCDKTGLSQNDYLIFGHFYGECFGEQCVETFKLTDEELFEDSIDDYSGQKFKFDELDNKQFEEVKNLVDLFPNKLLNQKDTVFGCPDCADGGGLFIQYAEDGNVKSWRIDQNNDNVPEYLHDFIDEVNAKIDFINN